MTFLDSKAHKTKVTEWISTLGVNSHKSFALQAPALLVVDMQKDFLSPDGLLKVWGGPAVIPNVKRLMGAFHAADRPVIFSRHIYEDPERDGGATARWWKVDRHSMLLREGTWHAELSDTVKPGPKDKVLAKRRYSAFYGTDLELLLRTAGVKEIVISGVCTNICCEATAHDAFFRDFDVFFLLDGTGATDEPAHLSTLRSIALSYGTLVTTSQIVGSLDGLPETQDHT